MNLYDITTEPIPFLSYQEDGYSDFDYDTITVRAVAENRYRAMQAARLFITSVYGCAVKVDKFTKMRVRKIAPAWNGADTECDWPSAFEHGCQTWREFAIEHDELSALDALCYTAERDDDTDPRSWAIGGW